MLFYLSFLLGSLAYELHELIKLRRDDDLSATVALLAGLCVIGSNRVVLTTTTCRQTLRIHAIVVLQCLNHAGGTQGREVPVVTDVGFRDGHIVGITLNQNIVVLIVLDDLGNLREGLRCTGIDLIRAALVKHIVGQ